MRDAVTSCPARGQERVCRRSAFGAGGGFGMTCRQAYEHEATFAGHGVVRRFGISTSIRDCLQACCCSGVFRAARAVG